VEITDAEMHCLLKLFAEIQENEIPTSIYEVNAQGRIGSTHPRNNCGENVE